LGLRDKKENLVNLEVVLLVQELLDSLGNRGIRVCPAYLVLLEELVILDHQALQDTLDTQVVRELQVKMERLVLLVYLDLKGNVDQQVGVGSQAHQAEMDSLVPLVQWAPREHL
jgi:hypothetical protein